jgi:predicted nucleotidyltransferase
MSTRRPPVAPSIPTLRSDARLPRWRARVARDLRELYGDRLVEVLVFGSRARGDHEEDSDLDLLVVLDRVDNRSAERDFMGDVIWQHTYDSGILVSALPVSRDELAKGNTAFLRTVKAEGVAA